MANVVRKKQTPLLAILYYYMNLCIIKFGCFRCIHRKGLGVSSVKVALLNSLWSRHRLLTINRQSKENCHLNDHVKQPWPRSLRMPNKIGSATLVPTNTSSPNLDDTNTISLGKCERSGKTWEHIGRVVEQQALYSEAPLIWKAKHFMRYEKKHYEGRERKKGRRI